MKTFSCLLFVCFLSIGVLAQNMEFGSDLALSQPTGSMARNINNAFGITLNLNKNFKAPFALGAELAFSSYGNEKTRQEYAFDDGTVTETDVYVSNNIATYYLTGKYFLRNNKNINPYLSAKAGWSWFKTTLTIEDPEDEFSCHPVESDILAKDNTYIVSTGAGVRVDFNAVFRNMEKERLYFDLNVHRTQGGTVRYMNADKDPAPQSLPEEDVMASFINTQTQVIHEHHVGYVYSSIVSMIDYKVGVVFRLGCGR